MHRLERHLHLLTKEYLRLLRQVRDAGDYPPTVLARRRYRLAKLMLHLKLRDMSVVQSVQYLVNCFAEHAKKYP